LVAFVGGDPDKPVIVGQMYNQIGLPAALSSAGDLPGNRYLSGLRSREVAGDRKNQLRFDDTRGEISVQLSSDHMETQLNMGFITDERAEGSGAVRGEGAELCSSAAVSVRGAAGVLIAASGLSQGNPTTLDRDALLGSAIHGQNIESHLVEMASQLSEDSAAEGDLKGLIEAVDCLNRGRGCCHRDSEVDRFRGTEWHTREL
jgi:type VI secretion system secreted protein VgrG